MADLTEVGPSHSPSLSRLRIVVLAGAALAFLVSVSYAPWVYTFQKPGMSQVLGPRPRVFVLMAPRLAGSPEEGHGVVIDWQRLLLEWTAIGALAASSIAVPMVILSFRARRRKQGSNPIADPASTRPLDTEAKTAEKAPVGLSATEGERRLPQVSPEAVAASLAHSPSIDSEFADSETTDSQADSSETDPTQVEDVK